MREERKIRSIMGFEKGRKYEEEDGKDRKC